MIKKLEMKKAEWLQEKDVFLSAIIIGLISHLYMMTNKIPNIDDYISMFHYGGGYASGRWLLALIGNFMFRIDGNYSLPLLNGLLFVVLLSMTITIFLKPFVFQGRWIKRIFAGLFVAFPTVTATMGYVFTVPFYGFAVLFMAVAFYLLISYRYGFLFSIFLICCSLGIYQAYWGLVAGFLLLYLISLCMEEGTDVKSLIILAIKSAFTLLLGIVLYLVVNSIMIKWQGISMSGYQGLNQMGSFDIMYIPQIIKDAYGSFFKLITGNYLYITYYGIVRIVIAVGYILVVGACVLTLICNRKEVLKNVFLLIFVGILPLTVNSIYIMCNDKSSVHTLMCYSVVLVFFMPFVFLNGCRNKIKKQEVILVLKSTYLVGIMIVAYFYVRFANIYYLNLELAYHETYSFMETLSTRIQETEDYAKDKQVYFYGQYTNPVNRGIWELRMVNQMIGTADVPDVINAPLLRQNFFRVYIGNAFPEMTDFSLIEDSYQEIENMPVYPDDGSISIINDVIVVKLGKE